MTYTAYVDGRMCHNCGLEPYLHECPALSTGDDRLREALADTIALLAMLNDNAKSREMIPYYTAIVDKAMPELRAALGPLGMRRDAPSTGDDRHRALAYSFWVYYRCGYVDCTTVEPHEHGGGPAMREMTPEERALSTGAPDTGSDFGRLLAERDRLIDEGVDPADLDTPLAP